MFHVSWGQSLTELSSGQTAQDLRTNHAVEEPKLRQQAPLFWCCPVCSSLLFFFPRSFIITYNYICWIISSSFKVKYILFASLRSLRISPSTSIIFICFPDWQRDNNVAGLCALQRGLPGPALSPSCWFSGGGCYINVDIAQITAACP